MKLWLSCYLVLLSIDVISYDNAMTTAEHKSGFELTKDTPYLVLMGELCGVCCEDLEKCIML